MNATSVPPVPPRWLTTAADLRIGFMLEQMGGDVPEGYPFILTPLTEPPEHFTDEERERWERTCDNCGKFCPEDTEFYTGAIGREVTEDTRIEIMFGACPACVGAA
jgi:hypothetical protein